MSTLPAATMEQYVVLCSSYLVPLVLLKLLFRNSYPSSLLTCGASGVIGYGVPGAMAARLGLPGAVGRCCSRETGPWVSACRSS